MGSGDMKQPLPVFAPGKRYLNIGFVAGFLLVFLTYIVVTQQFSITAPNATDVPASVAHRKQATGTPSEAGLRQEDQGEEKTETTTPAEDHQDTSGDSNQEQQLPEQEWRPKEEPAAVVSDEPPKRDDTAVAKPFGMNTGNKQTLCESARLRQEKEEVAREIEYLVQMEAEVQACGVAATLAQMAQTSSRP